ncbi:MAG TPA: hypothetical protein VMG11_05570 [Steroidobacteraceae bacterium]|nr:hypothetical protein [Steroidobacteraceae bacterium]
MKLDVRREQLPESQQRPARAVPVAAPLRPYLLFVRAGADSLHRRLIAEDPDRNWDCCVSWYAPPVAERIAEYYSEGGFNKLEGFLEFWKKRPLPWSYRYIWIIDDDVYVRPGAVSRFFELCERHGTYLAQPALRWLTHTTLNVLVRNPACLLRRVSFVEVMAPCFSHAALEELIHTFGMTKSTWGTDWAWACLSQGKHALYVVDAIAMEHTRTGDGRPGPFYRKLHEAGIDPAEELRQVREMFPDFIGPKTLDAGHVFKPDIPPRLAPWLLRAFERSKWIVRLRKQVLRQWRHARARLEDRVHGAQ